uniref:Ankyrin and armadillo repeat-containing protein n=1 Tax=Leptobrachium leishanense TaxID=445787 RepID=A0A8C5PLJ5_9ANUR
MEALSEYGWEPIHHAAYRNHISLVERLVESTGADILETLTNDGLKNTPLLLATFGGREPMVNLLVNLGVDINSVNGQNHGVVEICALHGHLGLIRYLLCLDHPRLNVCRKLVAMLESDLEKEIQCSCAMISELTSKTGTDEDIGSHTDRFIAEGLISGLLSVLKSKIVNDVKNSALNVLKMILCNKCAKRHLMESGGTQVLVSLLLMKSHVLLPGLMEAICELTSEEDFTDSDSANIVPALLKVISDATYESKDTVLLPAFKAIGLLARCSVVYQEAIGKQVGFIPVFVKLHKECQSEVLLVTWSVAVGCIARENSHNQDAFMNENIISCLLKMMRSRYKDVKMSSVKTVCRLAEGNIQVQKTFKESGVVLPIIQLLRKNQSQHTQEAIAETLWVLAGADIEAQRIMAARIGVSFLVEFLVSPSCKLNLIGSRGLSVLLQGPYDLRNAVATSKGAHHLLRLLRSSPEEVVLLNAVRALRHVCLGVGYVAHSKNQAAVATSRGLKSLVAVMTQSQCEYIKVEAALAIAASVQGHTRNLHMVSRIPGFSYRNVLGLLSSSNEEVRLLAGEALASFAFNSSSQQKELTRCGGVHWGDFAHFLDSDNPCYRAQAAFQIVVLARVILDKDPSYTSATGIQILVGLLDDSHSNNTVALATDCVARLAHTRAGLPEAMVSIDVVNLLCHLLSSPSDRVHGSAAIALNLLSFNHAAERQLLKRLREDPQLMKVLIHYNKPQKWPAHFLQRWNHIRELNLPPLRSRKKSSQSPTACITGKTKDKIWLEALSAELSPEKIAWSIHRPENTTTHPQLEL